MIMLKTIGITCLAIIVALIILSSHTLAQSSGALESRVSRLESDNFQLRSQISRIESHLAQLSGRSPSRSSTPNRSAPQVPLSTTRQRQVSSSDPMFDRLATLVVELKGRVQALETQVAELKKQRR